MPQAIAIAVLRAKGQLPLVLRVTWPDVQEDVRDEEELVCSGAERADGEEGDEGVSHDADKSRLHPRRLEIIESGKPGLLSATAQRTERLTHPVYTLPIACIHSSMTMTRPQARWTTLSCEAQSQRRSQVRTSRAHFLMGDASQDCAVVSQDCSSWALAVRHTGYNVVLASERHDERYLRGGDVGGTIFIELRVGIVSWAGEDQCLGSMKACKHTAREVPDEDTYPPVVNCAAPVILTRRTGEVTHDHPCVRHEHPRLRADGHRVAERRDAEGGQQRLRRAAQGDLRCARRRRRVLHFLDQLRRLRGYVRLARDVDEDLDEADAGEDRDEARYLCRSSTTRAVIARLPAR